MRGDRGGNARTDRGAAAGCRSRGGRGRALDENRSIAGVERDLNGTGGVRSGGTGFGLLMSSVT